MSLLRRFARLPLAHFLALGAALYGGAQLWTPAEPIRIDAAEISRLRAEFHRDLSRAPTEAELAGAIGRYADEQMLLREALRLGLDRRDPVARDRLLRNLRFAFPDAGAADEALLELAARLGMPARDIVVRRRLIQLMEARLVTELIPPDEELRRYAAAHASRYAQPAQWSFRHVFFSADEPGSLARAQAALAGLRGGDAVAGDPFLLGDAFTGARAEIARRFGETLARGLEQVKPGQWSGPLQSAYGWHLVRLEALEPARPADFPAIRTQLAYAWAQDHEREQLERQLADLRERYTVELP